MGRERTNRDMEKSRLHCLTTVGPHYSKGSDYGIGPAEHVPLKPKRRQYETAVSVSRLMGRIIPFLSQLLKKRCDVP